MKPCPNQFGGSDAMWSRHEYVQDNNERLIVRLCERLEAETIRRAGFRLIGWASMVWPTLARSSSPRHSPKTATSILKNFHGRRLTGKCRHNQLLMFKPSIASSSKVVALEKGYSGRFHVKGSIVRTSAIDGMKSVS